MMTAGEQIKKAEGRRKARARGMVPDQRGQMRDRIVKGPISPMARAVHNPRMQAIRRLHYWHGQARKEAAKLEAERRKWGIKRARPSFIQRVSRSIKSFMKGKGHR